ncbi:polysaccharide deacetylase family protein [Paenibacillus radicis (ex Xue et al. 2023)]|uniref:Polysaccharide deacetylase family protein n=1 Tax=Paenibacillus radicis (ex Xue et al. 2023) TaxID=2972489 RepID=A0ABT1YJ80_9BACL|nr:polysaccharide deacetylase family protein [Paenibacillus radicis (ex Xue et al. 2023)]MCR8633259.1 polysaccharide deacetylase family protein [Paenibacillus radicis (ex Xue et al. 2023)]
MKPLSCLHAILSLSILGLTLTGCTFQPKLKQNSNGIPPQQVEAPDPTIKTTESKSTVPLDPLVRFPEWPIPGIPPVDNGQPRAQAQPEQAAPQPEPVPPPVPQVKKPVKQEKPAHTATSQQNNRGKRLTLSQLVKKYPDLLLLKGSSDSKKIALTFDDAPDTHFTPQVLDVLKKHNVKATFFIVGRLAEKHPDVVKRMVKEGHIIGNHTYNHALLTKLSDEQYHTQVNKTQKILRNIIGYTPKLLRPPYGEISESQLLWASEHQLVVVNWNVDSLDWKQLSQQQVTTNILSNAKAGSIILQHSGGGSNQDLSGTVNALPTIIESLRSKGYQLVTLPDLLHVSKQL